MSFRLGWQFIIPFVFAFYPTILIVEQFELTAFIGIVFRTCFCLWLFSSALSMFDRRRLSIVETVLRFVAAFAALATSPMVYLPAIVVGIVLIWFDRRSAASAVLKET